MNLARRRLTPDFTLFFLAEALVASARMIYACTTFGLILFSSVGYS